MATSTRHSAVRHPSRRLAFLISALLGATLLPAAALAQDDEDDDRDSNELLEEIVVTARKREELASDVPLSVSAYSAGQLEALKIRDMTNLSVGMPNVATDDIGTIRGTANFSIRGLGINSSIPSIDPTVGVFVDGVYIGQNIGLVLDMFDIASIEVLRGPQGTLFGRNVTGGAILVNTKRPTDELAFTARGAVDGGGSGGISTYLMGAVSGPMGDSLNGRLSIYYNDDEGWFKNLLTGDDHGEAETTIFRPSVEWQVSDRVNMILRWEHLEAEGDGPASQTHINGLGIPGFFVNFERDSFNFSIDEPGFYDFENDLVTWQTDWAVDWGNGTITNIFGWKDYSSRSLSDIDAQPVWIFHAPAWANYEQVSNELRYNGQFDRTNVTVGLFLFDSETNYHERRNLLGIATGGVAPALTQDGGGNQDTESQAVFASFDYDINEAWTLNAGIRYTQEDKEVEIASLIRNVNRPCNVVVNGDCPFDFRDSEDWSAVDGKLGFTYDIDGNRRIYGGWSRSHRSGGYNLRNTALDTVNFGPGPFDEETVDSFEIGYKSSTAGRGRFNAALFYMEIEDMQREINLADPNAGVVQVIRNTADADILGIELDGVFRLTDSLLLTGNVGWIDPEYDKVLFDLNGDGVLNSADEDLELPRAAELTYSIGLNHDLDLGDWGEVSSRISYSYRDDAFYTDNNLGFFLDQEILDAGIDWHFNRNWTFSLYGRNLLDEVNHGGDTQLPPALGGVPTGGTFSPLTRGRIIGAQVTFEY